jgi:hypothetical protein
MTNLPPRVCGGTLLVESEQPPIDWTYAHCHGDARERTVHVTMRVVAEPAETPREERTRE